MRIASWLQSRLPHWTAASGIGYIAMSYTVSRWLTRRAPATIRVMDEPAGMTYTPVACRTMDGIALAGWVVTPRRPHATIALFHGLRQNRTQMLGRIAFLTAEGYRCVAFDHRAHGQSGGRRTSFGFHERRDVEAVAAFIECGWPDQPRAALGVSMGAAALCFAAPRSRCFDALVLESLYHDLASAFQHRVGGPFPGWFNRFRRGIIWVTERRLGARLQHVAPVAHIGELAPRPVLLLTGSRDPYAPPEEMQRLYQRCRDPRACHVVPGAGHADVCSRGGGHYRELVLSFLDGQLRR